MQNTLILTQAIIFAAKAHNNQMHKGSDLPYIVHPMEAVAIAATMTEYKHIVYSAVTLASSRVQLRGTTLKNRTRIAVTGHRAVDGT